MTRISFAIDALIGLLLCCAAAVESDAQTPAKSNAQLKQPVHRVAKGVDQQAVKAKQNAHPLDPCLRMALAAWEHSVKNIRDYSTNLVKRERYKGKLQDPEKMFMKVRNRKEKNGQIVVPYGIYIGYQEPSHKKGQEAIWVQGANDDKILAHGTGLQGLFMVRLTPEGRLATTGTNYTIRDSGIEELINKLVTRAQRERQYPPAESKVQFYRNAKINGRACTLVEVTHPKRDYYDFHIARIFIDDEYKIPVRFASWLWPEKEGAAPPLLEEFTYYNLKINVGLTNRDFDPQNPAYDYP